MRSVWIGWGLVLTSMLLACGASHDGTKGGLVGFGPEGMTDEPARRFALVIGIDTFDDERFNELRYATTDAHAMAEAFDGFDHVVRLTEPEETDRESILDTLRVLRARADRPRDILVVYVSSHGTLARKPGGALQRYVVARDSKLDQVATTAIAVQDLVQELDLTQARRKALILAMCHSGVGKSHTDDELAKALSEEKSPLIPLDDVSEAMIVVSAAARGEPAREEDALGHDIYTYYLLKGMKEGDTDADGAVTLSEAHDYARDRTYAHTNGLQRPSAETRILGRDPIVLHGARQRAALPVLYNYDNSAEGIRVVVNDRTKGVLPGGVAMSPGQHSLRLESDHDGEVLYEGALTMEKGQRTDVAVLIKEARESHWRHSLRLGTFVPLESEVRDFFWPVSGNLSWTAARHWGRQGGLVLWGRLGYMLSGRQDTRDTTGYTLHGAHASLGAGWEWALSPQWSLTPALSLGQLMGARSQGELLFGSLIQAEAAMMWSDETDYRMGAALEMGTMVVTFGNETLARPIASLSFQMEF